MVYLYSALAIVASLVVLLILFAMTRPDTYRVERSTLLNANPEAVFPYLHDLKLSNEWSPWSKLDPAMKLTYADTTVGPGAYYEWDGDKNVGAGKFSILNETMNKGVKYRVEFLRPFKSVADGDYTLTREGSQTRLTWSMDGKHNLISKVMCLFMNMDAMIGKDFEKGLNTLKGIVDKGSLSLGGDST